MNGTVAVCFTCGAVYYASEGHACTGRPEDSAARALTPAVTLPDGTPHPVPFLAERGWLVAGGIFRRPDGGGDGEEAAA